MPATTCEFSLQHHQKAQYTRISRDITWQSALAGHTFQGCAVGIFISRKRCGTCN